MTDLDALEAVLAKATQGEWENHRYWVRVGRSPVAQLPLDGPMNAAAIAALHNAAPALIAEHRALLARVEALEEAIAGPEAWLNRWAAHVGNCKGSHLCTCGLARAQYDLSAALEPKS